MKRLILTILIVFCGALSIKALNYDDARREAWFLTDKMAYELNLTPEQCDIAYQINLDYFLSIRHASDCRGVYWRFRNDDLRCVLFSWQYSLYRTLDYFYYPIRWARTHWYYPVCHHYRRGYYYFDRPVVYVNYHGSSWRHRSQRSYSPYRSMQFRSGVGMRDRYHTSGSRVTHTPGYGGSSRPSREVGTSSSSRPDRDFGTGSSNRPSREVGGTSHSTDRNSSPSRKDRYTPGQGSQQRPTRSFGSGDKNTGNSSTVRPVRTERSKPSTQRSFSSERSSHSRSTSSGHSHERGTRSFGGR